MNRLLTTLSFLCCVPWGWADEADFADETSGTTVVDAAGREFFERQIRPLLSEHCLKCHSSAAAAENGELDLQSPAGIARGGTRGRLLSATADGSHLLLTAVGYLDSELQMPPDGQLTGEQIQLLKQWVKLGLPVPEYQPEAIRGREAIDFAAGRRFWSFQPLHAVQPPGDVPLRGHESAAIDAFVADRLSSAGLSLSAAAAPAELLRRLSFDLTGLPPEIADLQRAETAAGGWYESEVERLLAAEAYGERWTRFWLDLARYTDFTPDWQTPTDRGWLYRDWVVDAFNRNLAFDEFVRLQLAADLIPEVAAEDHAALGFLGLSPTYWKELRLAPSVIQQIVADEWDERTDAVTRTFLGLTVSCARCHDHKFDPISTQDYYGLAGVVASSQLHERPLLEAETAQRVIEGRKQLEQLQQKLQAKPAPEGETREMLEQQVVELRAAIPQLDTPFAHVLREATLHVLPQGEDMTRLEYREGEAMDLEVFRRGNPSNRGDLVPRRFLTVLSAEGEVPLREGSGRRQLAEAILQQGQALTARVIVNRIWAEHFGSGLVRTTSDFGQQGERPTHPELLNYLAWRFVEQGWDMKWLHRQILLSRVWQQSSAWNEAGATSDPDNRLLWRSPRRQLPFEMWRDAILSVSGRLQREVGGPGRTIDTADFFRRSLYLVVDREELHPVQRMHDFPEASAHSPIRVPTTTPLQQLYLLNSDWVLQRSQDVAARTAELPVAERVSQIWMLALGRRPSERELTLAGAFVADAAASETGEQQWQDLIQSVLSVNEFYFLN